MKCFPIALHHVQCNSLRTGRVNHDARHGGSFRKKNTTDEWLRGAVPELARSAAEWQILVLEGFS